MIVERDVFQAKYGHGDELVALLKESKPMMIKAGAKNVRILTDLTGTFFTVVMEVEYGSAAEMEKTLSMMGDPEFEKWFQRMVPMVDTGNRQLFSIVD